MSGFGFTLAQGVSLNRDDGSFFLLSRAPIKMLRINESLFNILKHIRDGGELADFPVTNPPNTLKMLLSLAARGYLKLTRIAPLKEFPFVSVIVPVRDQPEDLRECLESLEKVDYPKDRREIIVVDDGSKDEVAKIVAPDGIRVIRQEKSIGAAACRNTGAQNARGDILAFLDADCIAGESWLKDLVPFLQYAGAGAAGGFIEGYNTDSFLDRYEKVFSPLNMGRRLMLEGKGESGFYVPTASLLVTAEAFTAAGGFKEGMRVGEDVDFCWRLRERGYTLVYAPYGSVAHKHRNKPGMMLKRRAEYGTSEAALYRAHRDKKKGLAIALFPALAFLALTLAILLMNPYPLFAIPLSFLADLLMKSVTVRKLKMDISLGQLTLSALRTYLSFFYFIFFHLARYYLVLIIGVGFAWHPFWIWGGAAIIFISITDYAVKKPALFYPVFLCFYILEHLAYQAGVFWGCLIRGYFGSYLISFKRA